MHLKVWNARCCVQMGWSFAKPSRCGPSLLVMIPMLTSACTRLCCPTPNMPPLHAVLMQMEVRRHLCCWQTAQCSSSSDIPFVFPLRGPAYAGGGCTFVQRSCVTQRMWWQEHPAPVFVSPSPNTCVCMSRHPSSTLFPHAHLFPASLISGAFALYDYWEASSSILSGVTITGNTATGEGGAVYIEKTTTKAKKITVSLERGFKSLACTITSLPHASSGQPVLVSSGSRSGSDQVAHASRQQVWRSQPLDTMHMFKLIISPPHHVCQASHPPSSLPLMMINSSRRTR